MLQYYYDISKHFKNLDFLSQIIPNGIVLHIYDLNHIICFSNIWKHPIDIDNDDFIFIQKYNINFRILENYNSDHSMSSLYNYTNFNLSVYE